MQLFPERVERMKKWAKVKTPTRIFVNSMSDLFAGDEEDGKVSVPVEFIESLWEAMALSPQHTFQILTKRPARMAQIVRDVIVPHFGILPQVALGTSTENQEWLEKRIEYLLATPAAIRFLSCEPLLGSIDLAPWLRLGWICEYCYKRNFDSRLPDNWYFVWQSAICDECIIRIETDVPTGGGIGVVGGGAYASGPDPRPFKTGLSWVIIGGESGNRARPMNIEWADDIIKQCKSAGVAVFMKQTGTVFAKANGYKDRHGGDMSEWPEHLRVREFPQTVKGNK
jgi:protein gp37